MAEYRASLARLAKATWRRFLPGHGPEIADPAARLAELIAHRTAREAQIRAALTEAATPSDLVARIYPALSPTLRKAAEGNILAHLLELATRGEVLAGAEGRFTPSTTGEIDEDCPSTR